MRIAIDALLVYGQFSGVEHAILHQARALLDAESPHEFVLVGAADVDLPALIGSTRKTFAHLRAPCKGRQRLRRLLYQQLILPGELHRRGIDLLYAPGYLTALRWTGPSVVFVHDTIALTHPHLCKTSNALNYRLLLPLSSRAATRVAVPSRASAGDVARFCRVPAGRIDVVPLGVDLAPVEHAEAVPVARARLGIAAPYILAVSTIEPKKNFADLIRWFGAWKAQGIPHHLVIIGKWGWKSGDVRRALRDSAVRADIHLPGYLPQAELPAIIAAADLLVMPSRYEGFGLPALEAMAVGAPVVVSDRGSLPETAGDAGLVLALEDDVWIREIPRLLTDSSRLQSMRLAGFTRARTQTWGRTADLLLASMEQAFRDRGR